MPPTGVNTPIWPWVLWNLWKARNKLVFDDMSFSAQDIVLKSIKDAKEWKEAQTDGISPSPHNPSLERSTGRSLVPPPMFPPAILVVKVDAAWDATSGGCGIGGIFTGAGAPNVTNVSEAHSHVSSNGGSHCCSSCGCSRSLLKCPIPNSSFRLPISDQAVEKRGNST